VNNPRGWLFLSSFLFAFSLMGLGVGVRAGVSGFLENKEGTGLILLA